MFDVVKAGKSTSTFSQQSSILSKVLSESAQDIQTASLYFSTLVLSRFHFIPCKDPPKIFKRFHFIFQLRLKFSYYLHSNRAVSGLGGLEQPQRHLRIKFVENFHNLKHYHFFLNWRNEKGTERARWRQTWTLIPRSNLFAKPQNISIEANIINNYFLILS